MGQEIASSHFTARDFVEYRARLLAETEVLRGWFGARAFRDGPPIGGFEVEAWLVDHEAHPAPVNEAFLARVANPLVVPELAQFNVEINTPPLAVHADMLQALQADFGRTWAHCNREAAEIGAELLVIGILPTVREAELTVANMSSLARYRALNEQILRLRGARPIQLDIRGVDHLHTTHRDVMLESAATSFQIHLEVSLPRSVRVFNAAQVLCAPMVAVSANSPFLFGRELWDETRIPLFQQAVAVSARSDAPNSRVSFGKGYAERTLMECFDENCSDFDILLPTVNDEPADRLCHLRLHNGTIWRWNRPLVGFETDGTPHLRIEHRVVPAGPSLIDTIANAALFFGLVHALSEAREPPESCLPFAQARANFYAAARQGLNAAITWLDGSSGPIRTLLLERLLPLARAGLQRLEIAPEDIDLYLGVIEGRLRTGRNGAAWQRGYAHRHGRDMQALTCAYRERQRSGTPVHEWRM